MNNVKNADKLYVILHAGDQPFAIPIKMVHEMVAMPSVTKVPQGPPHLRGVINLRGRVMPVVDLRTRLGMRSCQQEAESHVQMMEDRERDHVNWLNELESAVKEDRDFRLARDPHQCQFGKWYYSYQASSSTNRCLAVEGLLLKLENPHNRIHALADHILGIANGGQRELALKEIEKARSTTLSKLIELFTEVKTAVMETRRELAVIIGENLPVSAIAVDMVETVETLEESDVTDSASLRLGLDDRLIAGVGRRQKDGGLVLKLDVSQMIELDKLAE